MSVRGSLFLLLAAPLLPALACGGGESEPTEPDPPEPEVTTIEVTPSSAELEALDATRDFDATARDQNGNAMSGVSFSWSVSPDSVGTVDGEGTVTARAEGTASVEAAASGVTGSARLEVDQAVAELRVSPDSVRVEAVGDTALFSAEVRDANGNPVPDADAAWASSDTSVVTVDSAGRATARGEGTARVRAEAEGAADSAAFRVAGVVASVEVIPDSARLRALEDTADFDAAGFDRNGNRLSGATFTWSAAPDSVASVDADGTATAEANGVASVVAGADGVRDTAELVVDQEAVAAEVSPDSVRLRALGDTADFDAAALDRNGNPVSGAPFAWSAAPDSVASVDADGTATAEADGIASVVAGADGLRDTAELVVDQEAATLEVSPDSATDREEGDTVHFSADGRDRNGNDVSDLRPAWSSSDTGVATVDSSGVATAEGGGTAQILARADGAVDSALFTVVREGAFFERPFEGTFRLTNTFDHDLPRQFQHDNGVQLTWWGEEIVPGVAGHEGWDWLMPVGTPLRAVADGEVEFAGETGTFFCPALDREVSSKLVRIEHTAPNGDRIVTVYDHLSRVDVGVGETVSAGDRVGLSGDTGCSTDPHLHFETRRARDDGTVAVTDPYGWEGDGEDPWSQEPDGTSSRWLWETGEAPELYRETPLGRELDSGDAEAVITRIRWLGVRDDRAPNNEFVEITGNPEVGGDSVDMSGWTLKDGDDQTLYTFPDGTTLVDGSPIRVFSGPGDDTETTLHMGHDGGVWSNMGGCAQLFNAQGHRVWAFVFWSRGC